MNRYLKLNTWKQQNIDYYKIDKQVLFMVKSEN